MNLDAEFRGLSVEEAVFYTRLGLQLELMALADVSEWVDEVILREESPDAFFLELYRVLHTNKAEVPAYLKRAFPAASCPVRPALGWLHRQLLTGTWALGQLIRALYRLRTLVESDPEVGWIYGLAADYDRVVDGPPEAVREVQQETEAFLACYQDYTFANRAHWPRLDAQLEQRLADLRH